MLCADLKYALRLDAHLPRGMVLLLCACLLQLLRAPIACVRQTAAHQQQPACHQRWALYHVGLSFTVDWAFQHPCLVVRIGLLSLNVDMSTSELGMPLCLQVVRVAVLALKNLLADEKLQLGPDMVEAGLPKVVQQRSTQVGKGLFRDHPWAEMADTLPCSLIQGSVSPNASSVQSQPSADTLHRCSLRCTPHPHLGLRCLCGATACQVLQGSCQSG